MLLGLRLTIAGLGEKVGFPRTEAGRHQVVRAVEKHFIAWTFAAGEHWRDVVAVERPIFWRVNSCQSTKRRQEVERAGELLRNRGCRHGPGLPHNRRLAHAALPRRAF